MWPKKSPGFSSGASWPMKRSARQCGLHAGGRRGGIGIGAFLFDVEIDAAVVGHLVLGAILGGFKAAFGKGFETISLDAGFDQIVFHASGASVAKRQIVFVGAAPVAMAFEQELLGRVVLEVFDRVDQ